MSAIRSLDIIIPTYDNLEYLIPCVNSILVHTALTDYMRIIVVNNGSPDVKKHMTENEQVLFVQADKNLGWEGGLKLGLEHSQAPFVCFMNDDTFVPFSSHHWLNFMLQLFQDQSVAAVGPTTNVVMGNQNIFFGNNTADPYPEVTYLIGYCMVVRRSYLDQVGGVDDTLPGGDDFDLCIRLRKAGHRLRIARPAFVYHHGFKTGIKVRGSPERPGGWNSREMTERTNTALIQKHGFRTWLETLRGVIPPSEGKTPGQTEADVVRKFLKGEKLVELGCGGAKVEDSAIGVDRIAPGETIPHMNHVKSVADIQADVSQSLPFPDGEFDTVIARHILEHCADPIATIGHWIRIMKDAGRLVLALPDHRLCNTIPLNPEHVHAYTPESIENLMRVFGLKKVGMEDYYNGVSFTIAFERNGQH